MTTLPALFINVPSEGKSIEGQRAKREWTTCFCHTVRMKEDECKQGEDRRRVGVGLALLRRMGTGGMPDSAGTSHARIYHSAAVTAGQGTDVSVYLGATSDWPSLAFAPTALPTWPLRLHEREKVSGWKKETGRYWVCLQEIQVWADFSPFCFVKHLKDI